MTDFIDQFYGTFTSSSVDLIYRGLAEYYNQKCDEYDNRVCSGTNEFGEAVPCHTRELVAINIHAKKVKQEILENNPWVDPKVLRNYIVRVGGY